MSSGVSDELMKSQSQLHDGKKIEERNIPWSQQVDEASYENLASSIEGNISGHNEMQKSYNTAKKDGYNNLQWGQHQHSNSYHGRASNNHEIPNKSNKHFYTSGYYKNNDTEARIAIDDNDDIGANTDGQTTSIDGTKHVGQASKKLTWASIASQPAKQTLRANSAISTLKKKGPGMPPPPMVPGKHNMDIGTWDVPSNSPILVPPSPPSVIPFEINELSLQKAEDDLETKKRDESTFSDTGNSKSNVNEEQMKPDYQNTRSTVSARIPTSEHVRPPWMPQHQYKSNSLFNPKNNNSFSNYSKKQNSIQVNQVQNEGRPHHINIKYKKNPANEENSKNKADISQSEQPDVDTMVSNPVLEKLRDKNNYNPVEIDLDKAALARFFVIKSYSEDDIHRSIKYEIWCSTDHGNKRLDEAFREREKANGYIYLLFSVNGSGHFCGMAQMMTPVDYNSISSVWSQDKWRGKFKVQWIYVKDVPNGQLRHIRLENNENKSVTNSRDTQEVPNAKGVQVLKILHSFKHQTSIFDDFYHYEKRQEQEVSKKYEPPVQQAQQQEINITHNSANRVYRQGEEVDKEKNAVQTKFGNDFRDKYNFNRQNNYYDNRRNDQNNQNNRATVGFDTCRESNEGNNSPNQNRENNDYINRGFRYDYNKRDERDTRSYSKHNNRDRDFRYNNSNMAGAFPNRAAGSIKDTYTRVMDHPVRDGLSRGHMN